MFWGPLLLWGLGFASSPLFRPWRLSSFPVFDPLSKPLPLGAQKIDHKCKKLILETFEKISAHSDSRSVVMLWRGFAGWANRQNDQFRMIDSADFISHSPQSFSMQDSQLRMVSMEARRLI
jgi:hypothetical protein